MVMLRNCSSSINIPGRNQGRERVCDSCYRELTQSVDNVGTSPPANPATGLETNGVAKALPGAGETNADSSDDASSDDDDDGQVSPSAGVETSKFTSAASQETSSS